MGLPNALFRDIFSRSYKFELTTSMTAKGRSDAHPEKIANAHTNSDMTRKKWLIRNERDAKSQHYYGVDSSLLKILADIISKARMEKKNSKRIMSVHENDAYKLRNETFSLGHVNQRMLINRKSFDYF